MNVKLHYKYVKSSLHCKSIKIQLRSKYDLNVNNKDVKLRVIFRFFSLSLFDFLESDNILHSDRMQNTDKFIYCLIILHLQIFCLTHILYFPIFCTCKFIFFFIFYIVLHFVLFILLFFLFYGVFCIFNLFYYSFKLFNIQLLFIAFLTLFIE